MRKARNEGEGKKGARREKEKEGMASRKPSEIEALRCPVGSRARSWVR